MTLQKYLRCFAITILFNCLISCGTINRNESSSLTYRGVNNVNYYLTIDNSERDHLGAGVDFFIKSTVIVLAPIDFLVDTLLLPIDIASINTHKITYTKQYPPLVISAVGVNLTNTPTISYKFNDLNDYTLLTKNPIDDKKHYITLPNPQNPTTRWKNKELLISWQGNQTTDKTHTNIINFKASDYKDNIVLVVVFLPCDKTQHYFYYIDDENITNNINDHIKNRLEFSLDKTIKHLNTLELGNKCSMSIL